ncbi:MAG: S1/P1 nuclease [Muribaculaceae bacterium]|nr:S1/P1 nuclease [Muribaculaceae bacterium]
MTLRNIFLFAATAFTASGAYAWGQKGHDVVAYIAEKHLTPTTKAAVENMLGGRSIVYWSNWLDNASHTPTYAHTKTWHYRNIDADQEYDTAPRNRTGDVVSAINEQVYILSNPEASAHDQQLALKILVHCLGDIHQPMHMGHYSDLGGNKWMVKYFNSDKNLHSIWDSSIVESGHKWTYTEWQEQIDRVTPEEEALLMAGDADTWGRETYRIATEVYNTTPEGTNISFDYIAKWTPVIEDQLLKGGLRLADILNGLYDPAYLPYNTIKTAQEAR